MRDAPVIRAPAPPALGRHFAGLFKAAAVAAVFEMLLMLVSIVGFLRWPIVPGTTPAADILNLTQTNIPAALIGLDFGLTLNNFASMVIVLALFAALRPVNESRAFVALVLGLVAVVSLISCRSLIEIFTLGRLFGAAQSEADKLRYVTEAETLLTGFHGTAWHTNMLLGPTSYLLSATLMLRSTSFGKTVAIVGIVLSIVSLLFWIPKAGVGLLFLSMLGWLVWLPLLSRSLLRLSRLASQ